VILFPAAYTRFENGIILKEQAARGKVVSKKNNAMCAHEFQLTDIADINNEVMKWQKVVYEHAG